MNKLLQIKLGDIVGLAIDFLKRLFTFLIGVAIVLIKLIIIFLPVFLLYRWNFQHSDKLLEYIKVLIWPLFAFYFVRQYKSEVGDLINRIISFPTPFGNMYAIQQPIDKPFSKIEYSKSTIESTKVDEKKVGDDINLLKKELEMKNKQIIDERKNGFGYYLKHQFEKAYRVIFGSQISILLALEFANKNIMSHEAVHKIYEVSEFHSTYSFSDYISFLLSFGFITFDGINITYTLSGTGQEFLNYLRKEKLPFNKKPY
jgi:hypothetical protein